MASTYSTSLRLELMATGDQSGTWGDTTNTNLGTLLEQAITGVLSVAQGDVANLTLTNLDGASDQARNAVVRVTGALTATRNVVVQTANKLYTIVNATTGGFSIVAKTSAGTGVSIPPGASVDVYSDGTNVVMGQNYWNGQIGGAVYLDAGATVGPVMDLFRDSTSPAASDILGQVIFNGRDSAGNKQEYGSIQAVIADPTSASEDASLDFYAPVAGVRTLISSMGPSLVGRGAPTNSSAAAGFIGETIDGSGSGVALTSNTAANVASISLTAGDWEVSGTVSIIGASGTNYTFFEGSIGTVSATRNTNVPFFGSIQCPTGGLVPATLGGSNVMVIPPVRVSLSATTTYYLVAFDLHTISTSSASGAIHARRAR